MNLCNFLHLFFTSFSHSKNLAIIVFREFPWKISAYMSRYILSKVSWWKHGHKSIFCSTYGGLLMFVFLYYNILWFLLMMLYWCLSYEKQLLGGINCKFDCFISVAGDVSDMDWEFNCKFNDGRKRNWNQPTKWS